MRSVGWLIEGDRAWASAKRRGLRAKRGSKGGKRERISWHLSPSEDGARAPANGLSRVHPRGD